MADYPKHQPGSIVRVTVKNFVTYTAFEFFPGPSLNMIIGPNGTGKSTLVCAICLGLGAKTEVLGRAKDLADFVHYGAQEAEIEIELAADPQRHRSNPVVKRVITKKDNKTAWYIDGRSSNNKSVLKLCRDYDVQIDNLCQFLPQERVVEFAGLTPVELLKETQRAAAPEHMSEWHNQLKSIRSEQKKQLDMQNSNNEKLKNLEGRQNLQRADVERIRERAEIQEELDAKKKLRPFPQYNAARNAFGIAKTAKKHAQAELRALNAQSEPALRAVRDKEKYVETVLRVAEQRDRLVKRGETQVDSILRQQDELLGQIKSCDTRVEAEKTATKKIKADRARLENEIRNIKRQMEQVVPDFDIAGTNEQTRHLARRINEKEEARSDARANQDQIGNDIGSRSQRIQALDGTIANLRSKSGQQTNKLRNMSKDTAQAWDWIQNNRDKFSGKVFGPPLVECSVDPKYAKIVEAIIGGGDVLALTATDVNDYNMLQDELTKKQGLSEIHLRQSYQPLSFWKPTMPVDQLQSYGLTGYVLDLLNGPDEVLSMLCESKNMHNAAYALRDISNEQYEVIARSPITSWVTASESYRITRRQEYGDTGTSTSTKRLQEPKLFTNQPVDTAQEARLKSDKSELEHERQELQKQYKESQAEYSRFDVQIKEFKTQKKQLDDDKAEYQKLKNDYNKLPTRLETLHTKLEQAKSDARSYRSRVQAIKDEQDKLYLQKAEQSLGVMTRVITLQKLQSDLFEAQVLAIEAQSDLEVMNARNHEIRVMLEQKQVEVTRLARESDHVKGIAQDRLHKCNRLITDGLSDKETDLHDLIQRELKTEDEWEADIEATAARLEMFHEGNPAIIQEFEGRAKEIERLRGKLAQLGEELAAMDGRIAEVRQKWEPELDALVANISEAFGENFARIGCAGEVTVYKDPENFDQWAINIGVRFRYVVLCVVRANLQY